MSRKTKTDLVFAAIIVLLVLVILYSGLRILESTVFYNQNAVTLQTESKTISRGGVKYFPRQDITVVMFLGIGWDGEATVKEMNHGGAVDMAAVMIFDPQKEQCDILALNRDLMVDMPVINNSGKEDGTYFGQLAYSHTYGTGMEDSCVNTRRTISNLLYGLRIDYYFSMRMDAIGIVNDSVGGVTVNITDDFSGVDPTLTMGPVTLRGEQARTFVQSRMAIGDGLNLSRMRRQEEYLRNLVPAMQAAMEEDETFPIRVYEQIADYTVTDCTAPIISRLAEDYGDYSMGEIYSVPGENRMGKEYMEFYADEEALDELILELFYAPKK